MADEIDDILARYAPKAAAARDPIDDVLERYSPPKPKEPAPRMSARDIALATPPDESEGPQRDPVEGHFGPFDKIAMSLMDKEGVNETVNNRRDTVRMLNQPAETPMYTDKKTGKTLTAGDLRTLDKAAVTTSRALGAAGAGLAGSAALANVIPASIASAAPVATAAATGAAGSMASQVVSDTSDPAVPLREMPKRTAESGLSGALVGGGLQIGAEAVKPIAAKVAPYLRDLRDRQITQQATEGANPTFARRLAGRAGENAPEVAAFVERHPEVEGALGNKKRLMEAAETAVDRSTAIANPVYPEVTARVGSVPAARVIGKLRDAVESEMDWGGSARVQRALEAELERATKIATKGGVPLEKAELTHRKLRDWVTRLFTDELHTMGSISETEAYQLKDQVHRVGQRILNEELDAAAARAPELADKIKVLRAANLDTAMGLRVKDAAENAVANAYWKQRGALGDKVATGVGALVGFGGGGPLAGVGAAAITKGIPIMAKAGSREATKALAELAQSVLKGTASRDAIEAAVAAGVPRAIAEGVVRSRQSPAAGVQP
jgi:hypothetical protein